jgi:hypothetical protein
MKYKETEEVKGKEPSYAIPGFGGKGRGAAKAKDMKSKGTARQLTYNSARPVRAGKIYKIMDCFARPLPNAVRKMATVGSCPVRPTAVRHSPICHRVMSARLRPVLRRGASRCHFAWRACRPVPPHFGPGAPVVCNCLAERQKAKSSAPKAARASCAGKKQNKKLRLIKHNA